MAIVTGCRAIAYRIMTSYTDLVSPFFPESCDLLASIKRIMAGNAVTFVPLMIIDNIVLEFYYLGRFHCIAWNSEN
jgi:hypothetical protein